MKSLLRPLYRILLVMSAVAISSCESKTNSDEPRPKTTNTEKLNGDHDVVKLSEESLKKSDIQIASVKTGTVEKRLHAIGRLSLNLNKTAKATSTFEGRLTELKVDLSDKVRAGQVIGLIDSPELLGKQLELKSPIDGVIIARHGTVGELVPKGGAVCTISDPSDLWLVAEIDERDAGSVKVDQAATFTVLTYPSEIFQGTITRLGEQIKPESRTLEVRISVNNQHGKLRPGMFANIDIAVEALADQIIIPASAIQTDEEQRPFVFVVTGEDTFEKKAIKTGLQQNDDVQILDGLNRNDRVVSSGSFILKSELQKSRISEGDND
jgi:multidrug efflux pump subunit AcrA (membrane-fusion protein)